MQASKIHNIFFLFVILQDIEFSIVYSLDNETTVSEAAVIIGPTRCSSAKEPITGELTAKDTGVYTLIFDNSYSRLVVVRLLLLLLLLLLRSFHASDVKSCCGDEVCGQPQGLRRSPELLHEVHPFRPGGLPKFSKEGAIGHVISF